MMRAEQFKRQAAPSERGKKKKKEGKLKGYTRLFPGLGNHETDIGLD